MNTQNIIRDAVRILESDLKKSEGLLAQTNVSINEAPSAMQSGSDTTRYQLAAVAKNQDQMMDKLRVAIRKLQSFLSRPQKVPSDVVEEGSAVCVQVDDVSKHYIVLPCDDVGGIEIQEGDETFLLLSSNSPMSTSLKGKKIGDSFSLTIGRKEKRIVILNIE